MLYLSPPYFEHDGIVIGRDYSDPTQYWYYPNRPRIAVDEQGRPAVRLLIYKEILKNLDAADDEVAAGFLIFDTTLAWEPERLEAAAARIKQDQDLDELPRLSPLLYKSGKVRMTFLDRKSVVPGDPPPADEDDPDSDWVSFIESSGMPSLYGENRAIFSVGLTTKGARFVLGSFDGFIPAGVVYDLDYVAMQRAYNVKVDVKWDLVYHYIQEIEKTRVFFYSHEVEKVVEKLIEDKKIVITGSIEGVGDEGMEGEYREVRKQLTQFVFEKFFEPKINPKAALDDTPRAILGFLEGFRDAHHPMQFGGTRRELDVEQIRTFSADFTTYRAVERKIAPQGHLSVFWEDLNVTKEDVITVVDDEEALWRIVDLRVLSVAKFSPDAVAHIVVEVVYGHLIDGKPALDARVHSVVLDSEHPTGAIRNWFEPSIGSGVHYRYTVAFGTAAHVGGDVQLTTEWRRSDGGDITVNPGELFEERSYTFQRSNLLKAEVFPEAVVRLRYTDPGSGWTFDDAAMLDTTRTSWTAKFNVRKGAAHGAEYWIAYPQPGGTIEIERREASSLIMVDDPRENVVRVKLMVTDRTDFEQAIVTLEHSDPDNDVFESETIVVGKDEVNDDHEWQFRRAAGAHARYRYSYVLLKSSGSVLDTGWVESDAPVLMIGDVFARKWSVRPELVGPPLAQNGVDRVVVDLSYVDEPNDYREDKTIVFSAPGQAEAMTVNLRDAARRDYRYTVAYVMTNGFQRKLGPFGGRATFPTISSVPPLP
jgi:hypothetical protein